jgi:hypothetical protein
MDASDDPNAVIVLIEIDEQALYWDWKQVVPDLPNEIHLQIIDQTTELVERMAAHLGLTAEAM